MLRGISFQQAPAQKLAIAGETGSGKSTLLKTIAGLIEPDQGTVWLSGERVIGPAHTLVAGHPAIAYLSQQFELPGSLRVEQVLRYARRMPGDEAQRLYDICHIEHLMTRRTDQLSGGERQRIALARLLSTSPQVLLLDEPFSNLDMMHKHVLKGVLHDLGEQFGITCILVSHDPVDTLSWADRLLVMHEGAWVQQGAPETVYHTPVNDYVAGLLGRYTILPPPLLLRLEGRMRSTHGHARYFRPEHWVLASDGQQTLSGRVMASRFYGSHHEATVRVEETDILVSTGSQSCRPNDQVQISLNPAYRSIINGSL